MDFRLLPDSFETIFITACQYGCLRCRTVHMAWHCTLVQKPLQNCVCCCFWAAVLLASTDIAQDMPLNLQTLAATAVW